MFRSSDPSQNEPTSQSLTGQTYRVFTWNTKWNRWSIGYIFLTEDWHIKVGHYILPHHRSWGCCGPFLWPELEHWWKPAEAEPPAPPGCWRFLPITRAENTSVTTGVHELYPTKSTNLWLEIYCANPRTLLQNVETFNF